MKKIIAYLICPMILSACLSDQGPSMKVVVCDGENTEPEYFNAFRLTSATVKAVGKGLGTMSLVKEAIAIREKAKRKGKSFYFCCIGKWNVA